MQKYNGTPKIKNQMLFINDLQRQIEKVRKTGEDEP